MKEREEAAAYPSPSPPVSAVDVLINFLLLLVAAWRAGVTMRACVGDELASSPQVEAAGGADAKSGGRWRG